MKLGNHIRQYRFKHDQISQQKLANTIGVTRLTIHSIEKGKFVPSTMIALKLAKFFKTKVEKIFYLKKS
ncbi:helix-turn-helix transcriptional regulator [Patescibacteria group bacterium]